MVLQPCQTRPLRHAPAPQYRLLFARRLRGPCASFPWLCFTLHQAASSRGRAAPLNQSKELRRQAMQALFFHRETATPPW